MSEHHSFYGQVTLHCMDIPHLSADGYLVVSDLLVLISNAEPNFVFYIAEMEARALHQGQLLYH